MTDPDSSNDLDPNGIAGSGITGHAIFQPVVIIAYLRICVNGSIVIIA